MRSAALAFGVLAGLVASLILALGGLDVTLVEVASGDRQASLTRFALFVIANLGVFAAALALSAPLAAAILMGLGALGWLAAGLLLRHGPDLVLITPPALLLIGLAFGIVAHIRRPAALDAGPMLPPLDVLVADDDTDEDDSAADSREMALSGPPPGRLTAPPSLRGLNETDQIRPAAEDWQPRKRRPPPPRTGPIFRQPDDEDDGEESRFGGVLRGLTGVLSFGLYATVVGAAVLVFWNLRTGDAAAPVTAAADRPISSSRPAPSSSEPVLAPILSAAPPSAPGVRTVGDTAAPASAEPSSPPGFTDAASASSAEPVISAPPPDPSASQARASTPPQPAASSSEPPPGPAAASGDAAAPVMPFPMTSRMAAERARPAPARPATTDVTGL